ncbi:MAG: di/tricarboxylate transporter [Bradymonadia bacterium]|jgi:di/tricarboxylate transporter
MLARMDPQAIWTICVGVGVFVALASDRFSSEVVVLGGLVALLVTGVLQPEDAFAGFSNPGVVALAGMYVITAGLRETGAMDGLARLLLKGARSTPSARRRLSGATVVTSAFLNNTPIVALTMPIAGAWAKRWGVSVRGLLLPLSYAAVFGGACTLLGTAAHMVVHGLLIERGMPGMGLFELVPIGVPIALVCLPVMWWLSRRLLDEPDGAAQSADEARREYTADLKVSPEAPFIGQTIEDAGLRNLPGLFLVRVERKTPNGLRKIAPVGPLEVVRAEDRLTFAGQLEMIVDLQRRRGLDTPQSEHAETAWMLHEAVISRGSRLDGRGVRELAFRTRFNAAIVAVHRRGERIEERIGDIKLRHGDTLLMNAAPGFARAHRDSSDFYLVTELADSTRPRHARAPIAAAIMVAVVGVAAAGLLPLASVAAAGAVLTIVTGCLSPGQARRALDLSVIVVIAAALGIARALEQTGAAAALANGLIELTTGFGPVALLACVYVAGMILTEMITNTAAAALLFPIALSVAISSGLDPRPFAMATSVSAAISLATPLGYQTNMMVFGPGGYRFSDFVKMGVPLQLLAAVIAIAMISWRYGL